jgi:uncharacterized membrane protein YadS
MSTSAVVVETTYGKTEAPGLFKHEDYWAIWLGIFILFVGLALVLPNAPEKMDEVIARSTASMAAEEQRAPFRTVAWHEANDRKARLRARDVGPIKELGTYLRTPSRWTENPRHAFVLSEEEAAARRAAAAGRHERAKERLGASLGAARQAEEAAATAQFRDEALNQKARDAIGVWRSARDAESRARSAATVRAYNLVPGLLVLMAGIALLFAVGIWFMGRSVVRFLIGFPFVFVLATAAYFLAAQSGIRGWGLEYVLWAILLGLLVSNTIGTPKWVQPAVQVEYYIKTGLVLLGASILVGKIVLIGLPGIFVTWVVTPIVLITTFWFGQRIIKMESKRLNIVVSADMSVSGVSAAIATAAACRAKKEELTLAVGISVLFTAFMIFAMPTFIKAIGMNHVLGGAWMGGTIDATGAVVAAGALLSDTAMHVAATIKMIQNIMIGVIAFGVAAYWATSVERTPGIDLSVRGALAEIWLRFPKFVLGFLAASIVFSIIYQGLGRDAGNVMLDEGVIRGWTAGLQGWFFCLAFVSIGLATNFRDLAHLFKGGKPLTLYLSGQTLNLLLTLAMAYLMFFIVFPWVSERLLAS